MQDSFSKEVKIITRQQMKAIHVYFAEMSDLLNESGIAVPVFLSEFEVDYTKEMIKDIWRKIAKKQYNVTSTSDLTTAQVQSIYEEFNRHVSKFGLTLPFPANNPQWDEETLKKHGIIK